jgi:hypothetical protein
MTHPIIARLYMDRQRQQQQLEDARDKLEEAAFAVLCLHPVGREYGSPDDYRAACDQYNDWRARIQQLIYDLSTTAAAISDSLSAPDSHLKGYPR